MISSFSAFGTNGTGKYFMIADEPCVAVVLCYPAENGYLTRWWVTGKDWKTDVPTMLSYFELSINSSKDDLEVTLRSFWSERLEEVSLSSAIAGGITLSPDVIKRLSEADRDILTQATLQGHAHLRHFNVKTDSVVEKTANMYLLLRSMGVWFSQKAIAKFETFNIADNWTQGERGQDPIHPVKSSLINQRLILARRKGYIPEVLGEESDVGKRGRKSMPYLRSQSFIYDDALDENSKSEI
jgi:hypothetical protein